MPHASPSAVSLRPTTLDDKYEATEGNVYLSGIQALVRLCIVQRLRDQRAGLNTAGFVSGYRGSPLGGLDEAFWHAHPWLEPHHVKFVPGVNEDLAATAVWGSQQVHLLGESDYDGVFGLWYGKGPGVDRSVDVLKHMSHAGTARHGGVLLIAGDDHGAYSSTLPHQSDHVFAAAMIPVLYPCNVAEYIELGIHGWAMSRFSGCPIGFKALADTVESSATIAADPFAVETIIPADFDLPEGGLNCRLSTDTLGVQARKQEALMQDYKIYAAMAYARANKLNRIVIDSPRARLGIVASGKSYMDVLEALEELGITPELAANIGIRVLKVAMPWPLEPEVTREFAQGLEEVLIVEEKRQIIEYQLKEQLYNWREDVRPRVIGKFDERGEWNVRNARGRGDWLLPAKADFSVAQVARVIAARIHRLQIETHTQDLIKTRLSFLDAKEEVLKRSIGTPTRPAYYCSGCPHNSSTKVPEGSFALAGIGCHVMATAIYPEFNKLTTHMGGEGAPWIGAASFSKVPHVFSNLGDGTYFHSGYLAIRASVAASRVAPVNITYKILYNDAVAMTGGQPVDGQIDVAGMARQLAAEGVVKIAIVSEDVGRHADRDVLPPGIEVHDRSKMDDVQRMMREVKGVSAIIYDQTCAAEKRRRRKKGEMHDPDERTFINELVCEGCGDCGVQSNCTSLLPKETPLGRKRVIDQSSCNKDTTCVKGFCPSFVTVKGAKVRKPVAPATRPEVDFTTLPEPVFVQPRGSDNFNILITGIGGTGVITIGALLGMASHLEGRGASVLDMTGMSQKNGSVTSHVRLAQTASAIKAQRIPTGEADLILGCDILTAGSADAIGKTHPVRTTAVVNAHEQPPGQFAKDRDWTFPTQELHQLLADATGGHFDLVDATQLATGLMGDSIATNMFMLGYAFQKGLIPLHRASILKAIELNGVAVKSNQKAFDWGRVAAVDLKSARLHASMEQAVVVHMPESLHQLVERRRKFLADYQDDAYAGSYTGFVESVSAQVAAKGLPDSLSKAVATALFKLMAYKDEYEVARLYVDPQFKEQLARQFEGDYTIAYHLAPPMLSKTDAHGHLVKRRFGAWMGHAFPLLARLKFLRGTALDIFGKTAERRMERALIVEYREAITQAMQQLNAANHPLVLELARLPQEVRGFGHVKERAAQHARQRMAALLQELNGVDPEGSLDVQRKVG
ncbi:indolepyruvate ferredoxin oxidoreductase family protein [Hydrogenophaga sp. 2FB]|uniref:indolepyruvate ferredoxin oxidoreductase family protein n=1 Tax=Hydrogenophaga sp. 2FB TaxID=2502187 RepID=UPI0010F776EA|nr:indolepyruvate ferredoxin oxidoreductase family protein [Hydrogenophaga sp. 2FB]